MTSPTTDPAAYTDPELKGALARVIALARSEGLNDAEVQKLAALRRDRAAACAIRNRRVAPRGYSEQDSLLQTNALGPYI